MRRVPTSGGLELGVLETGPWIDIMPIRPGFRPELADVERAVLAPIRWEAWQPASMTSTGAGVERIKRTMRGVTALAPEANLSLRFLWSKDRHPATALYAIEEAERGLPYAMTGALLAAATARRPPVMSPHILATVNAHSADQRPPLSARLRRADLDDLVGNLFLAPSARESTPSVPAGAVDRARFWLAVTKNLWDLIKPDAFRKSGMPDLLTTGDSELSVLARALASCWLELQDVHKVHVAGVEMDIPEQARTRAWPQCMALVHDNIPPDAVRFLIGTAIPDGPPTVDRTAEAGPQPLPPDAGLCQGLAAALLREANDRAVYVPAGQFSLHLPQDYPLNTWGVVALRVVALPQALWCTVVTDRRQLGVTFHWQPGRPLRTWTVAAEVAPLLDVTLAALWRDLRIAGETAVPHQERPPSSTPASPAAPAPSSPSPRQSSRTLPSQRLTLSGKRSWGSASDHEAIRRRAHGVRGHLRRLHTGWTISEDARQIATEYGLPIPDGYTFVRPHLRGAGSEPQPDAGPATVIHARGLQAAMTLL